MSTFPYSARIPGGRRPKRSSLIFAIFLIILLLLCSRYIAATLIDYAWWSNLGQTDTWISLWLYRTLPVAIAILTPHHPSAGADCHRRCQCHCEQLDRREILRRLAATSIELGICRSHLRQTAPLLLFLAALLQHAASPCTHGRDPGAAHLLANS